VSKKAILGVVATCGVVVIVLGVLGGGLALTGIQSLPSRAKLPPALRTGARAVAKNVAKLKARHVLDIEKSGDGKGGGNGQGDGANDAGAVGGRCDGVVKCEPSSAVGKGNGNTSQPGANPEKDEFDEIDLNGDGKIELVEFIKSAEGYVPEDSVKDIFPIADADGDGGISFPEFQAMESNEDFVKQMVAIFVGLSDTNGDGMLSYKSSDPKSLSELAFMMSFMGDGDDEVPDGAAQGWTFILGMMMDCNQDGLLDMDELRALISNSDDGPVPCGGMLIGLGSPPSMPSAPSMPSFPSMPGFPLPAYWAYPPQFKLGDWMDETVR